MTDEQKRKTAIVSTIAGVSLFLGGAGVAGGVLLNELHEEKKDNFNTQMYIDMLEMDNFSQELTIEALQREIDKLTTTETVDSVKQKLGLLQSYINEKPVHSQEDRAYVHTQIEYLMNKINALHSLGLATNKDHELISSTLDSLNCEYISKNIANAAKNLCNYDNIESYTKSVQPGKISEKTEVLGKDKGYDYGISSNNEEFVVIRNNNETTMLSGDEIIPYYYFETPNDIREIICKIIADEATTALENATEISYDSKEDLYIIAGENNTSFDYEFIYNIDDNVLATYTKKQTSEEDATLINQYTEFDSLDQETFNSQYANIESKIEAAKNKNQETGNEK